MQIAIDQSSEAIALIDANWRYRYVNAAAARMWGYEKDELLEMAIWELDPTLTEARLKQLDQQIRQAGGHMIYEGTGRHADGSLFPRESAITRFKFDGENFRCTIQRDISERRRAEAALLSAARRLKAHVQTSPLAVIEWDMDLTITRWSAQAERLFEWPAEQVVGVRLKELKLIHPDDIDAANQELEALVQKSITSYVARNRKNLTRSGRERRCEWYVSTVSDENGKLHSILGVVNDITDLQRDREELDRHRHHLEEIVEERSAALEAAQDELVRKEKLSVLGRLTGSVSYELRNPLGTIKSSIYFVKNAVAGHDTAVDRALARADRNISRCDKIIDELLDYTRVQKLQLQSVPFDDWLGDVLSEFAMPAGIELHKEFDFGRELRIEPERFRRCVINVLSNACEAMTDGSRDAAAGRAYLRVSGRARDGQLEVDVEDSGPGIAEKDRTKIFEPLYSTKGFGVGLGLPIVAQIIEQHHDSLDIESRLGENTKVRLSLPLEQ